MATSLGFDYEVFLSFRGPDTRTDITDFLYTRLIDVGIRTFRDDEELRVGKEIGGDLLQAIMQSRISIPIFSKGYAESVWCLRELAQIVECKRTRGQIIMPIFFDVPPHMVRYQTKIYKDAFDSHINKKRFDNETIGKWKAALNEVGSLKGWDFGGNPYWGKGAFVKQVVGEVLSELKKTYLDVSGCLVEMKNEVDEIMKAISVDTHELKVIGIYGMAGVGKTTLAKIVYNQLSNDFEYCCFLSNIGETLQRQGIEHFQNQLITDVLGKKEPRINNKEEGIKIIQDRLSSKKVLLILDDVEKEDQLSALMRERNWFGMGSKIIITTKDKRILIAAKVDWTYKLNCLDFNRSLQLFSKHAFRRDYPLEDDKPHSIKAVKICDGLPLALEVLGSYLCGETKAIRDAKLKKLEKVPVENVKRKLRITLEALDDDQRNIFLDIACFFVGYDKRVVIHMWESCKFYPEEAIEVLQHLSLIKIGEDNLLWMHGLLRNLGQNMICQESKSKPVKQSRVWDHQDACDVMMKKKGGGNIEAIRLKFDHRIQNYFTMEKFTTLSNVRFLQVDRVESNANFEQSLTSVRLLRHDSDSNLLSKLRWLSWHDFPMIFKLSAFSLTKLVILDLSWSRITENWDGWSHVKIAKNLKVLNLTGCKNLRATPNFSSQVNLERLSFEACESLVQVDPLSIKALGVPELEECCHKLLELPDEMGKLESLTELLNSTSVREIPCWQGLKKLKISLRSQLYIAD